MKEARRKRKKSFFLNYSNIARNVDETRPITSEMWKLNSFFLSTAAYRLFQELDLVVLGFDLTWPSADGSVVVWENFLDFVFMFHTRPCLLMIRLFSVRQFYRTIWFHLERKFDYLISWLQTNKISIVKLQSLQFLLICSTKTECLLENANMMSERMRNSPILWYVWWLEIT